MKKPTTFYPKPCPQKANEFGFLALFVDLAIISSDRLSHVRLARLSHPIPNKRLLPRKRFIAAKHSSMMQAVTCRKKDKNLRDKEALFSRARNCMALG